VLDANLTAVLTHGQWWAIPMVFSGGLFVGGVISIAWSASPPGGQPTQ
jgi:hypothetical protein